MSWCFSNHGSCMNGCQHEPLSVGVPEICMKERCCKDKKARTKRRRVTLRCSHSMTPIAASRDLLSKTLETCFGTERGISTSRAARSVKRRSSTSIGVLRMWPAQRMEYLEPKRMSKKWRKASQNSPTGHHFTHVWGPGITSGTGACTVRRP